MRKITAGLFISRDGVVEAPDQWHFPYFNEERGGRRRRDPRRRRHRPLRTPRSTCPSQSSRPDGRRSMSDRVHELRLVVTAEDYDDALHFYRDVLGLPEREEFISPGGGRVTILEAGRATLELADPLQAEYIDDVEVGRRVAGRVRVAFQVDDTAAVTAELAAAGAHVLAEPTRTPWNSLNARLDGPAGLQLTLFSEPAEPPGS